jgi:hypothetical protein
MTHRFINDCYYAFFAGVRVKAAFAGQSQSNHTKPGMVQGRTGVELCHTTLEY